MNVNTASHDALMTLPGMEEEDVQTILTKRQDAIRTATRRASRGSWTPSR